LLPSSDRGQDLLKVLSDKSEKVAADIRYPPQVKILTLSLRSQDIENIVFTLSTTSHVTVLSIQMGGETGTDPTQK